MLATIIQLRVVRYLRRWLPVALLVMVFSLLPLGESFAQTPTVDLAAARRELAPTGVLRLGMLIGPNATNAAKDPATGTLSGVGVDLGNQLARRLGVSFQPSGYNVARDMVADLNAGKLDAALWVIDPGNAKEFDFSSPYLMDDQTYIVRSDSPIRTAADADQPGVRIATTPGSVFDAVLKRELKHATLVGIDFTDQVPQLQSGQVDAFGFARSHLTRVAAQQPGLRVVEGQFGMAEQAVTLPKGRPEALAFVNQVLEGSLASGFVQQAVARAGIQGLQIPRAAANTVPQSLPVTGGGLALSLALAAGGGLLILGLALAAARA